MKPVAALAPFAMLACLGGCMAFHDGPMPGEPKSATFLSAGGARVRYVDRGKGPAVVLLHGFASSLEAWRDVARDLEADHRVVALDLKGFGWTDRPEGDYSPLAEARLVLAVMDQLGIERAALVAHSWGASVALRLAMAAPARVSRLALYDAWVYEDQLPTTFVWARASGIGEMLFGMFYSERPDDKIALAFHDPKYVTQELIDATERALQRPGTTAAALAAVRGQRFAEVETHYREIDKPVLLLWGREDRVTALKYGEKLSTQLPDAHLEVFPQCGHFPMIEAERASTRALRRFLDASDHALPSPPAPAGEGGKQP